MAQLSSTGEFGLNSDFFNDLRESGVQEVVPEQVNVGLIGCGSMGSELARAVQRGEAGSAKIIGLFDEYQPGRTALANELGSNGNSKPVEAETVSDLVNQPNLDLVIECASQAAVVAHAETVLSAGKSMLVMSSGAMISPDFMRTVSAMAEKSGASIYIPSGAVGGIDALRASKALLKEVTIVSTKKPISLTGAPGFADWEDKEITQATVIYEGSATEAVGLFPANVNVAATVSMAGIGPDATKVRVVADPNSPGNVHEINAVSKAGKFSFRFENMPHETNPKTSFLAVLAAIETLRSICEPGLRIGT
ncbi:aspartate dehydrogenase [Candidatus Lucifugimonas marina]|uniref:L-aspartate dehydrogenase n=1 Tax=Candidatus Lucifugimonas marina TaxID=3038979 RepID=A0ABD4XM60_9CHLR|nr:aspartate dehydrogenase [SAR202 cluster bacterium JH702]MDG0868973.1 aspartate dehydrogenase [SAR202 cluster bacterium JH639]WFG35599.1 aspartate dehydrogenase [SAR202 cluster bacterium JH545]